MTRIEALEIAKQKYAAYQKADIEEMFGRGPAFDGFKEYGYRHGWIIVEEYSFNNEDLTGIPYDATQGGFAYL